MAGSADIFETLRRDIVSGQYEPMQLFDPRQLSTKYLTSVAPIREAMLRLSERGLLRWERNRGFFVEKLSTPAALFYLEQLRAAYLFAIKRQKENNTKFKLSESLGATPTSISIEGYIEWQRGLSEAMFCDPERDFVGIMWDRIWIYRNKYLKDEEIRSKFFCKSQEVVSLLHMDRHDECRKHIDNVFRCVKEILPDISSKIDA